MVYIYIFPVYIQKKKVCTENLANPKETQTLKG